MINCAVVAIRIAQAAIFGAAFVFILFLFIEPRRLLSLIIRVQYTAAWDLALGHLGLDLLLHLGLGLLLDLGRLRYLALLSLPCSRGEKCQREADAIYHTPVKAIQMLQRRSGPYTGFDCHCLPPPWRLPPETR